MWLAQQPRAYMSAWTLIPDDNDRVLLVQFSDEEPWFLPGAPICQDETPLQCAARAAEDLAGVGLPVGPQILAMEWQRPARTTHQLAFPAIRLILLGGR